MDKKSGFDIFGKKQILDSQTFNNTQRQSYSNRNYSQQIQPDNFERNHNYNLNSTNQNFYTSQATLRNSDSNQNLQNPSKFMKKDSNHNQNFYNPNQTMRKEKNYDESYSKNQNQPLKREGRSNENFPNDDIGKIYPQINNIIPQRSDPEISGKTSHLIENDNKPRRNFSEQRNNKNYSRNFDNKISSDYISNENLKESKYDKGYNKPQGKFKKDFYKSESIDYYLNKIDSTEQNENKQDLTESYQPEDDYSKTQTKKFKSQKSNKGIPDS